MICLGIEGTSHTFGIAIITDKGKILSEIRDIYTTKKGGIIPSEAAEHHKKVKTTILNRALKEAKLTLEEIDLISFSGSPGLPPCLLVTMKTAKEIALKYKKPILSINHCCAHLTFGQFLTKTKNPIFIFASGANTQILSLEGNYYRLLGETEDIGLGNALDKFGRAINLGFPCGPKIEKLANKGKYTKLPYTVKGMDLTFSGIVTEAINKYKKGIKKEDLCFSLQETCFAMLTEVTERALAHTGKNEILLIGGVAANKRLCKMLDIMCKERNAKFYAAPLKYSGDNATMICWQSLLEYKAGKRMDINKIDINPYERIDEIKVNWINV